MPTPQFAQKYQTNIQGLMKTNNVDAGVAEDMLKANLQGKGNYKGGGILDFNVAGADLQNELNASQAANPALGGTFRPPSMSDRFTNEINNQINSKITGINQGVQKATQAGDLQIHQNDQYLTDQLAKLRDSQAMDNNNAQTLQNRRGGFYSGGLDYQIGNTNKGYAEAQGGLQKDIAARNNDILSRNRMLAEQAGEQISQLQQQAPDLIQQRIQAELDRLDQKAMQKGQMLGSYVDPEVAAAYDVALAAKQANANGGNQAAAQAAKEARDLITSRGYDASLIGSDVTYEQALANRQRLGMPTLQKQQQDFGIFDANRKFAEGQRQFDVQTEETAKQFAEKMGYDWATLSQRDKESMAQLAISQQNADTSRGQLELSQAESAYKRSMTGKEVDAKTSAGNYADLLGELSHAKTYEEARKYVDSNIDALNEADYRRAMDYLGNKFPNSSPKQ